MNVNIALWTNGNLTYLKSAWTQLIDEINCKILNNCHFTLCKLWHYLLLDKLRLEIHKDYRGLFKLKFRILKIFLDTWRVNLTVMVLKSLLYQWVYKIDLPAAWAHRIFKKPQNQLQTSENLLKVWKFDLKYNKDLKFYLKLKLKLPS